MRKRRSYTNEMGDEIELHPGHGDHVLMRDRPKQGFRSNPIGFGADMSQHPKYKKTPRKG